MSSIIIVSCTLSAGVISYTYILYSSTKHQSDQYFVIVVKTKKERVNKWSPNQWEVASVAYSLVNGGEALK